MKSNLWCEAYLAPDNTKSVYNNKGQRNRYNILCVRLRDNRVLSKNRKNYRNRNNESKKWGS